MDPKRRKHVWKKPVRRKSKAVQKAALLERDLQWGREHETDSDEALLDYLRAAAAELGRTPAMREVVGGHYIARRFCDWGVAVLEAGLSLDGVRKPSEQARRDYARRRAKRETGDLK